jgi:hypothetical protein
VKLSTQILRYAVVVAAGVAIYYFLGGVVFQRMPYVRVPNILLTFWTTRSFGVIVWFVFLNIVGSLIAALPVALGVILALRQYRLKTALAISLMTALIVAVPVFGTDMSPFVQNAGSSAGSWVNIVILFLAIACAVPLLVWLAVVVTSNQWFERTRASVFDWPRRQSHVDKVP